MLDELRQVLTGPWIRAVAGIRDLGELTLSFFNDPDGGDVATIADDKSEVLVTVQDATSDTPTGKVLAVLFSPLNLLWALPKKDDPCIVAHGADVRVPGSGYAFFGGSGDSVVPDWLDDDNVGVYHSKTVHVESKDNDVLIKALDASKRILLEVDGATFEIKNGNVTATAKSGTGVATVTASAVTGKVALGPVANIAPLFLGAFDSMGAPVTQAPVATLTIIKGG